MSFLSEGGRNSPQPTPTLLPQEPIRLDETRFHAWAVALEQPRPEGPQRRPNRGMLPDVDLSLAVPAAGRPGFFTRLFRRLAGRAPDATAPPGDTAGALGEGERKPYVWVIASESKDAGAAMPIRSSKLAEPA